MTSTEFQKKIGLYHDLALRQPLVVTHHGRDKLVVLAADEYDRLKRRDREALAVEDLTTRDLAAVARAEPPEAAAAFDHEVD